MKDNLQEETKYLINQYHVSAKKALGQNFLVDQSAVDAIIRSACILEDDLVIEIGPGLGTLTKGLLEKAKRVVAIELDEKMIAILKECFFLFHNMEIIHQDVLKLNLHELIQKEREQYGVKNVKIVANLPYYITTPIVMKLLEENLDLESITVMIQKEVAQRLVATPGDKLSGAITYSVFYYATAQTVAMVPKTSFIPVPEVDSEVIQLKIRKVPPVELDNKDLFFRLIKISFMQRRKTLLNSLVNGNVVKDKNKLKEIFERIGLREDIRGEALNMEQFAMLSNSLNSLLS